MYGFKSGSAPKDKPKVGKIKGPGTGTSDSIKAKVPSGTYIMPADSTEQVGEKTLGELGKPVPVNLSNGEYQMPPEQVHAVGAQVLDQMKDATHTPVAAMGFKPQPSEIYFADGGLIDSSAQYWANDNAQFEAGNPSFGSRVVRALNPATAFGSAMGAMHTAAGNGDKTGMALAAAQAVPVFGAVRSVVTPAMGAVKAARAMAPNAAKTGVAIAGSGAAGAMADTYGTPAAGGEQQQPDVTFSDMQREPNIPRQQAPRLGFADGGVVESTDDLIARISAKYGTGGGSSPRPQPTAAPAPQQPAQRLAAPSIGPAADALRNRKRQIAEAAGFADGGLVDDEHLSRTRPSPQMGAVALGNQARVERMGGQGMYESANREIAQGVRGAFQNTDTAIRGASQNISDAYQEGGIPAAIGATVRNTAVPALGFAADVGRGVKTLIDPAANALKTAVTGDPTPIDGTRAAAEFSTQHGPQPSTGAAAPQRQAGDPASPPAGQGFNPSALTEQQRNDAGDAYRSAWQREAPAGMRGANDQALGFYNAEQQVRGSNITARRGANGVMEFSGNGEGALPQSYTRGFDLNLGNERMARANAIRQSYLDAQAGSDGGPRGGVIRNSAVDETNARFAESRLQESLKGMGRTRLNATVSMRNADVANRRAEAELAMREREGAAGRELAAQTEARRADADRQRIGMDQQRIAGEEETRGFQTRAAQRVEQLQQQYESAPPEQRAEIAEQIRVLSGREAPNRFTVVPGGQEFDPASGMMRTLPPSVINNQTGQPVNLGGAQASRGAIPPPNHIDALKKNPNQAAQFDAIYGEGAAARYLGAN